MEVGEDGGRLYTYCYCHHQDDSCIKTGSDERHFNVSLTVRDRVTRQCPHTTTFEAEKGQPKQIRTDVLLFTSLTLGVVNQSLEFAVRADVPEENALMQTLGFTSSTAAVRC